MRVEAANGVENVKYVFRHDIPIKIRAELRVEELHDEVAYEGIVEELKKGRGWSVRYVVNGGSFTLEAVLSTDAVAGGHNGTKLANSGVVKGRAGRRSRDG